MCSSLNHHFYREGPDKGVITSQYSAAQTGFKTTSAGGSSATREWSAHSAIAQTQIFDGCETMLIHEDYCRYSIGTGRHGGPLAPKAFNRGWSCCVALAHNCKSPKGVGGWNTEGIWFYDVTTMVQKRQSHKATAATARTH